MKDLIDSLTEATWSPRVTHPKTLEKFKGLTKKKRAWAKKVLVVLGNPEVIQMIDREGRSGGGMFLLVDESRLLLSQLRSLARLKVAEVRCEDTYLGPKLQIHLDRDL